MKNRKFIYTIISLIFAAGFYFYDTYSSKINSNKPIESSNSTANKAEFNFLPTSTTGQIVHHNFYTLSYNEKYEQAEWVAYELSSNQLSSNNFNRPYFQLDPKVSTKSAHYKNFKNSGYNKGHLCPAGDRTFSKEAYDETFLTSNVSPQLYDFNGGVWDRLEQEKRYWAKKYEKL